MSSPRYVGRSVPRVEDERLLRGEGRFVADLRAPGTCEVAFVRSTHAHARVRRIDTAAARAQPGVVAVFTAKDLAGVPPLELDVAAYVPEALARAIHPLVRRHPMPLLADERVSFVGQPLVAVVAVDRSLAEDAAELVEVDYEHLEAVVDAEEALRPGAPLLERSWGDNVAVAFTVAKGEARARLEGAPVVVRERFRAGRCAPSPIEPRGLLAAPDPLSGTLSVVASTQTPHQLRDFLCGTLGLSPERVRVAAPDVGGGFGQKGVFLAEDALVPLFALRLGRPVRWIEDRGENLLAATHGRDQVHEITLGAERDGRLVALADTVTVNLGAYNLLGLVVPYNTAAHLLGPYHVPAAEIVVRGVVTNTTPTAPYRGAGRPEAVFALERALDRLAAVLGRHPASLRQQNLVPAAAMPYDTGLVYRDGEPAVYDSGDYPALFARAVELLDVEQLAPAPGRLLGTGYAAFVEGTGVGPFESASASLAPDGRIRVETGATSSGQGHRTTLAQVAADALGVEIEHVDVVGGNTDAIPAGFGTVASRTMVVAGNAVAEAAGRLRERIIEVAAGLLDAKPDDLRIAGGRVVTREGDETLAGLAQVAAHLSPWNSERPSGDVTLRELAVAQPRTVTFSAAVHAVAVEVDPRTGATRILRYVVTHDCGRAVNPSIARGQIMGGVLQGIGAALYEEFVYDDDGQPRTVSLIDYLLPTAAEAPPLVIDHLDTPSPLNPLGVKGLGESGAIGPPAALANAIEAALAPFGVVVRRTPITPDAIHRLQAETASEAGRAPGG